MSVRGPVRALRRRWPSLLLLAVLGVGGGWLTAAGSPVLYQATASDFVSVHTGNSADDLVQGSTYTQNQVASFAELATTPAVLQPVITRLALPMTPEDLAGEVQAAVPVGTVFVRVTVTDASAVRSAHLANAIAASLAQVITRISPKDAQGGSTVVVTTVAPAVTPRQASSPDLALDLVAGGILGLILGAGLAWLRERSDTRVRGAEDLAALTTRPVLGSLPSDPARGRSVVVTAAPHSGQAEAYRQLRTNLQFLDVTGAGTGDDQPARLVAVTSALAGEGKSTTAANLAAALAETSARVLLVDGDLRRPSVAPLLGLEGAAGLTTVLLGRAELDDVVQEWGAAGLQVLTSGPLPPNPSELLGSPAMRRFLAVARARYDYVVVDSAPLLPVADGAVLAALVDGVLVLANVTAVRRHQLAEALRNLGQVDATVLGIVLNEVVRARRSYGYYGDAPPTGEPDPGPDGSVSDPTVPAGATR